MKLLVYVMLATVLALGFAGCGRGGSNSVTAAGSTAFQPFAEKLAEQFMARNPSARITVQGGGSALGIQSALSGAAQIGMADLVELPAEAKTLNSVIVARDGIALIVHKENKISDLKVDQVKDLFSGKISNWKDLGGDDQPVRIVSREAGSGTRSSFEKILGGIKLAENALIQDSNGTLRETVANDRNTIGYVSHGLLNDKVKAVKIEGQDCTEEAIITGKYKLVRPVFLMTSGQPTGHSKDFIDYILSPEGQETIKKNGLLPAK